MENMNLLDLDNDILNIIGDYVKKDNKRRIRKENDFEKNRFYNESFERKQQI